MAGRRWAQGEPSTPDGGKQRPRPSERGQPAPPAGAAAAPGAAAPKISRRERERAERAAAAADRPAPSPEAIARAKERLAPPKAPWHPLPLAELGIIFGFIAMAVSFAFGNVAGAAAGFGLLLLATVEFSWREHRHGFRSHGAVLGGMVGLIAAVICWRFVGLTRYQSAGVGLAVFLIAWGLFTNTYVAEEDRPKSD